MSSTTIALVREPSEVDREIEALLRAMPVRLMCSTWRDLLALLDREHVAACLLSDEAPDAAARCRLLRERGFQGALIVCARSASSVTEVCTLDAGADDYWTGDNPFSLLARIRACVRRTAAQTTIPAQPARVGRIAFERDDVRVEGAACMLTRRELSLLELLARNPGEVVTREEVLRHWGLRAPPQSGNFIDVHVMRLRRKLREAGAQLETVRGRGLCLHEQALRSNSAVLQA